MSIHPAVQSLLDEIEAFRHRTGISATAFGKDCAGDPGLLRRLEQHSPTIRTIERIRAFMRDQ